MILSVEEVFQDFVTPLLPPLIECVKMSEWGTRKMAVDVIYTLGAIVKGEQLGRAKKQVLEALNKCRFDKIKPVREAATEAIQVIREIKEIKGPLSTTLPTDISEDNIKKVGHNLTSRPTIRERLEGDVSQTNMRKRDKSKS